LKIRPNDSVTQSNLSKLRTLIQRRSSRWFHHLVIFRTLCRTVLIHLTLR
jgi:hypothetical protein